MKKKNVKGRILGLLAIAFIAANSFLIYFDEKEHVERKSYIEEWSKSFTYDLFETLHTEGVFASEQANFVYFNKEAGSFEEFLVEEGESVQEGDDLFTYAVTDYEQQRSALESKIDRLEEEIEAIEDYIDELEDYEIPEDESTSFSFFNQDDEKSKNDTSESPSYIQTEFLKEQQIAEEEAELAKTEAMLEMVEDQLDQLESDGEIITVTSSYTGVITEVAEDLEAPLLTLKSTTLNVEGTFTESQRQRVEKDMAARVHIPELEAELAGSLAAIRTFPDTVGVDRTSYYPFEVTVDEIDEQILPGYHANIEVILDQAEDVVTAFKEVLTTEKDLYAWVMTTEGTLERRQVTTGLKEKGMVEITKGLESGEWLAADPEDEFRDGAVFITPIDLENLLVEDLFVTNLVDKSYFGLLGLLSR